MRRAHPAQPARSLSRPFGVAMLLVALVTELLPALPGLPGLGGGPVDVRGAELDAAVAQERILELPFEASHVALRWRGDAHAHLRIAFGTAADAFGESFDVEPEADAA